MDGIGSTAVAEKTTGVGEDGLRRLVAALAERNRQLEQALETRVVIEQAKGVLAERWGVAPEEAFDLLRRAARSNRVRVRDLADRVVSASTTPSELTSVAPR